MRLAALIAAHSGDSPLWLAAGALSAIWGSEDLGWCDFGRRVLAGTLVAAALTSPLKWLFRRQRPPGERQAFYIPFDRHALPSGHASRSACLVVLLGPLLPTWGLVLLAIWAALVGLARVALGLHFLSDVLTGWVVGSLVGLALLTIF